MRKSDIRLQAFAWLALSSLLGCDGALASVGADAAADSAAPPLVLRCPASVEDLCADAGACCMRNLADVPPTQCSLVRCGDYVGVFTPGSDIYWMDFYDRATGELVAKTELGFAPHCYAGPAAFTVPQCTPAPATLCDPPATCRHLATTPVAVRRCTTAASCAAFFLQRDCNGDTSAIGVSSVCLHVMRISQAVTEATCSDACRNAAGPTTADDGTKGGTYFEGGIPNVRCELAADAATGVCVTSFADGG